MIMCENYWNGDEYVVAGFELYASELDQFRKLCLENGDLAQFIEKAVIAYLKRPSAWAPTHEFEGPRTRLYVRLSKKLHSEAMDLSEPEPIASAVRWFISSMRRAA